MGKPASKRNWLVQFLFDPTFIRLVLVAIIFFVVAPSCQAFVEDQGEHVALSAETTAWLFLNPSFGPRNVLLSQELLVIAQQEGISDLNLKSIIAAAAIETNRPLTMPYTNWLEKVDRFAADLLGLSKVETNYCNNLGGGIALEELEKRLEQAKLENPTEMAWWEANIDALERIAASTRVPIDSIPGSLGAGAISCFQLMPMNWQSYGGGHYLDTYQAARNAARFLKAHGYDEDREAALLSYNANAGRPYVDDILAGAALWEEPVETTLILVPVKLNPLTLVMEFLEILAWYMNEYGAAIGVVGEFVNPYPGSQICGNGYGEVISATYTHHGIDLCIITPNWEYITGSVDAMHEGRVVHSGLVDNSDSIAWNQSDPGYLSASGYVVVLEGTLPDGRTIQSIYAHLDPDTIPPVGATLRAGDYLATTRCSFDPEIEYCTVHHLHLGTKVAGEMVNPLDLLEGGVQ